MTDLTKLSAEQQKVRESLAKQLELLSKASDTAAGGVRSWEATERR